MEVEGHINNSPSLCQRYKDSGLFKSYEFLEGHISMILKYIQRPLEREKEPHLPS